MTAIDKIDGAGTHRSIATSTVGGVQIYNTVVADPSTGIGAQVATVTANNLNLNNLDGTAGGSVVNNGNNNFTATGANLTKHYENSVERTGIAFVEGGGKDALAGLAQMR